MRLINDGTGTECPICGDIFSGNRSDDELRLHFLCDHISDESEFWSYSEAERHICVTGDPPMHTCISDDCTRMIPGSKSELNGYNLARHIFTKHGFKCMLHAVHGRVVLYEFVNRKMSIKYLQ